MTSSYTETGKVDKLRVAAQEVTDVRLFADIPSSFCFELPLSSILINQSACVLRIMF
jgi:hypothetical protein